MTGSLSLFSIFVNTLSLTQVQSKDNQKKNQKEKDDACSDLEKCKWMW